MGRVDCCGGSFLVHIALSLHLVSRQVDHFMVSTYPVCPWAVETSPVLRPHFTLVDVSSFELQLSPKPGRLLPGTERGMLQGALGIPDLLYEH